MHVRLKYWRLRHFLTIAQCAARCHVSEGTITNIENNRLKHRPTKDTLDKLCQGLEVTLEQLVTWSDDDPEIALSGVFSAA